MARGVVWGVGKGLNGQDAGRQAAQNALQWVGSSRPALGLVFVAQEFDIGDVLNGMDNVLTNVPLWGFGTVMPWSAEGEQPRSVVIALITGSDFKATVNLYPNFAQDSQDVVRQMMRGMKASNNSPQSNAVLLAVDGVNGDVSQLVDVFSEANMRVAGGLASGSYQTGKTFLIGGNQSASGAVTVLQLGGRLRLAVGLGHGWKAIGRRFQVSRARSLWVNALDGASPVEAYAA
ncbi:MAG TPA: FIST N-terminal domain-containing protein, partial [Anaerolineaceae bacterium]|nr:FIST N-terminal domain-containing protein [Anaerolineaceae bacterium]